MEIDPTLPGNVRPGEVEDPIAYAEAIACGVISEIGEDNS